MSKQSDQSRGPRSAIVFVVDRLGAGYLGPYGNTWVDTPAFNRLAAEGVLVETAWADSTDLEQLYRSYWTGVHAWRRNPSSSEDLATLATRAGLRTALLTDSETVLAHPAGQGFSERVSLVQPPPRLPATEIDETHLAHVCAAALDWLTQATQPSLLWVHARGMQGAWDSPLELRERFRDEEDPLPYTGVEAPQRALPDDIDPDELLQVAHAYAGEVSVVDACLEAWLDAFASQLPGQETLFIFTSPRGLAMGEHGWIGEGERVLYGETLHVPLLMRLPDPRHAAVRLQALAQPADIFATLADWFGLETNFQPGWRQNLLRLAEDDTATLRPAAFSLAQDERSVRTPAWFLRSSGSEPPALYSKPDDRWEVNEVADRCGSIPDLLLKLLDQFDEFINADDDREFPAIASELAGELV